MDNRRGNKKYENQVSGIFVYDQSGKDTNKQYQNAEKPNFLTDCHSNQVASILRISSGVCLKIDLFPNQPSNRMLIITTEERYIIML